MEGSQANPILEAGSLRNSLIGHIHAFFTYFLGVDYLDPISFFIKRYIGSLTVSSLRKGSQLELLVV